jgi:two-component system, cell cycle response regulator DivK
VRAEEVEYRRQRGALAQPLAQGLGRQPGQRQQPPGAVIVGEQPAERAQRQGFWVGGGGWAVSNNCQNPSEGIEPKQRCDGVGNQVAKRILVVEDNDLNRKLFCDVLRSQGFVVEPVADGLEALDRARDFVPNLIIMDIQLPNVSGLDLIEAAKADRVLRMIPVLAVTAYAGKGDEERIRDAGADSYLAKPVSIGPFMAAVRALV